MADDRTPAQKIVGKRISALRAERHISQQDLGELADIHFTNIGKIERGEVNPTLVTLLRIAVALEVDVGELIQGLSAEALPSKTHKITVSELIAARAKGSPV
ncbi:helix-turn-helix domain-containing protein [Gulosibacter sp. 10]|uniref:helix-turn-helix domain-containing protein n=1 Tax=Gulosibacter sp. 10 TaxID=1255570 RepID=UPI00097F1229|nr:helix-turn-helix transcriptional regulator [Gulosibacter sp. 10]SJM50242.1 hypothetical protein FM112_01395 [Gulosibacter sp. 10]